MAKFYMFGKYSQEGIKGISPDRTQKAAKMIQDAGGKLDSIHATLGQHDIVLLADFPGAAEAIRASIAINKLTGIAFQTSIAIPVDEFDKVARS